MLVNSTVPLLVTILSISILVLAYMFLEGQIKKIIFLLFFTESTVLTFFFQKFPNHFSFIILISTIFLSLKSVSNLESEKGEQNRFFDLRFYDLSLTKLSSFVLISSVIIYEYFSDRVISDADFLVAFLAIILYTYDEIPYNYTRELDFLVLFFLTLLLTTIAPSLFYRIYYKQIGETSQGFISEEAIVSFFLAQPLVNILNLFGFVSHSDGQTVYFENLESGLYQGIGIAESCSGIISVQIFTAALFAFVIVERYSFSNQLFLIFILGIFVAYISNLFRMTIIIIVGHYWGMDALEWVHENIGWVIFTIWVTIFYLILNKFFIHDENSKG